jgi:hypothetical protein
VIWLCFCCCWSSTSFTFFEPLFSFSACTPFLICLFLQNYVLKTRGCCWLIRVRVAHHQSS